jgi:hypothetical protein
LAPKDCEPGQGRPARHSAVAIRSCNDLAQPGTGLVKDRDACAATVMAGWRRDGQSLPRPGGVRGPVKPARAPNFDRGGVTLVPFA